MPVSLKGPPITNLPVGLTKNFVLGVINSLGITFNATSFIISSFLSSLKDFGLFGSTISSVC